MHNPTTATPATKLYHDAEQYILNLITGPPSPAPDTPPDVIRQRAIERLNRMRAFLDFIGNPQQRFRSIHIGGTSGKGSTAAFTASILTAAGYRTGLHVSPYLQVATEKLVIDGRIAPAARYNEAVKQLAARADAWAEGGNPPLTYGEFWVSLTFLYFAEEGIDAGVIEVGAGGRFDLTNVIEPEVVAVTSIGLDHTVTLGDTIEQIAWHKAGIIKPGTTAVTAVQQPSALDVIRDEARSTSANLIEIASGSDYHLTSTDATGTRFVDSQTGEEYRVRLPGHFQAANAATAIAIARAFDADAARPEIIRAGLEQARFPGRMEIVQQRPLVLLDGAHNPQKIEGLAADIEQIAGGRRVIAVFGVLESKSYVEMVKALAPHVQKLITTSPQVYAKPAVEAQEVAAFARSLVPEVYVEPDPLRAIDKALALATDNDAIVATGSLYLVGNVRERWFPTEAILQQGTMWPDS